MVTDAGATSAPWGTLTIVFPGALRGGQRTQPEAWPHPDISLLPLRIPCPPNSAEFSTAGNNEWGVGWRQIASQHRDRLPQFTKSVGPISFSSHRAPENSPMANRACACLPACLPAHLPACPPAWVSLSKFLHLFEASLCFSKTRGLDQSPKAPSPGSSVNPVSGPPSHLGQSPPAPSLTALLQPL